MKPNQVRQGDSLYCLVSCPWGQAVVIVNIQIRTNGAIDGEAIISDRGIAR